MGRRLKAVAALLVMALVAAGAATSATARDQKIERTHAAKPKVGQIPAAVQAVADRLSARSVLLRPRAKLLAAKAREATPQPQSAIPGFLYCTRGVFNVDERELFAFPVTDSGHQAVITTFNLVESESSDFTNAQVFTHAWLAIQYAGEFYNYDTQLSEIFWGPGDYIDSWADWGWTAPTNTFFALVNEAVFVDNGSLSTPYYYVAPAFGPYVFNNSPFACYN